MKQSLVITALLISTGTFAKPIYMINGKQVTKLEAVEALIKHQQVERVSKCDVELTSKFTVKCKPSQRGAK